MDFPGAVDTCIVVPCFDEAARLLPAAFLDYIEDVSSVGFVFVDDGSTDDTSRILKELCDRAPERVATLDLPSNRGKAEAVRQGIQEALERHQTRFIGYWDADLATPLKEIGVFRSILQRRPSIDVVLGVRLPLLGHRIRRGRVRALLGRLFAHVISLPLERRFRDTQCGAKLFRVTPGLHAAVQEPFSSTWIFDLELLFRCRAVDGVDGELLEGVYEQPLERWTTRSQSKVKPWSYARALIDVPRVWYRLLRQQNGERRPQPTRDRTSPR